MPDVPVTNMLMEVRLKVIGRVVCVVLLPLYYVSFKNTKQDVVHRPAPKSWDARFFSDDPEGNKTRSEANLFDYTETTLPPTGSGKPYIRVHVWKTEGQYAIPRDYSCPGVDCNLRYVADTSYETMKKSDILILHHVSRWDWDLMIKNRPEGQKWVFFTRESPIHTKRNAWPPDKYRNITYDYTMTVSKQADIPNPYGYYDAHNPEVRAEGDHDWTRGKSRLIAWVASNCNRPSYRRLDFVQALSKQIKVNMYGKCGDKKCPKDSDECEEIIRSHKFYLALENCECRDYFTEKFWNSLKRGVVPLVYGAPKEDYARVAPPNSFIHLQDFASLTELADYIRLVDSNDTLYNSFFEWKQQGSVVPLRLRDILTPQYMCKSVVPKIITDRNLASTGVKLRSSFSDIDSWWSAGCEQRTGFPHEF